MKISKKFPYVFSCLGTATVCAALVLSCVSVNDTALYKLFLPLNKNRAVEDYQVSSTKGVVATAHPLASQAGALMLTKGGNSVDAAVAASFVISVVRPQSTGLGGGGFMLYHEASGNRQRVFDFRERAPRKATSNIYLDDKNNYKKIFYDGKEVPNPAVNGHLSVAIPGLVRGLLETHRELGRLSLKDVMAPAIKIAAEGFEVYPALASELKSRQGILNLFPASRKLFFKNGIPLQAGDKLTQADLAQVLRDIASGGVKVFYEGAVAQKIIDEMKRGHGLIDITDLRSYRVIERAPVKGVYRDHRIVSMPPPSSGGVHIIEMLNMLEGYDLTALHPRGAAYQHLLSEVMRRAFADRAKEMGDADFVKVPVAKLTSKAYAREVMRNYDPEKAGDSKNFGLLSSSKESPSTTHISVIDQWGGAVATTQTVNYSFGSCVVADGTGILLNDEMDDFTTKPGGSNAFGLVTGAKNDIAPGKTPLSSMSPTMVFDAKGGLELVLGSPGGPRIINATLQTMINVLDFKMPLLEAVHASRIHHQWMPDQIFVEPDSLDADSRERLTKLGHRIEGMDSIGDVQAVQRRADGLLIGVSDSRGDGKPAAASGS